MLSEIKVIDTDISNLRQNSSTPWCFMSYMRKTTGRLRAPIGARVKNPGHWINAIVYIQKIELNDLI